MPGIATSRNLSMDIAGLIGRASGAGKSSILGAAEVRAFTSTLTAAEVASLISSAVGAIDLSGYLPLTGGTLSGNLGVTNIVGPGGSTTLVLNNAGTGGTYLQENGASRAWIGGSGVGVYTAAYPMNSNLYDLGLTTRFWRKLFVSCIVPLSADLIIRDGTTAQAVRIDKTYTSDTNCEFLRVGWTGSNFDITSEVGSAGGINQTVRLGLKNAAGTFSGLAVAAGGAVTGTQNITATGFIAGTGSVISGSGGGAVRLWPNNSNSCWIDTFAAGSFSRIGLGVLTSSNPAIKKSGAGIALRLGDDSADTFLTCASITASGTITHVPPSSVTLGTNGQFAIEMTSNTAGNLVYRGSDGTTRRFAFIVS